MNYFISNYIPSSGVKLHPKFSQAGSNFINKLQKNINNTIFLNMRIVGIRRTIYNDFKCETQFEENILFDFKNKFFKLINFIYSGIYLYFKVINNKKIDSVWFYNITTFDFQLAALLIHYLSRKKIKFLVADLETKNTFRIKLQNFLVSKADKTISLRKLPESMSKNNIVMNGIFTPQNNLDKISNKTECYLYSGLIDNKHGMELVINTFKKFKNTKTLYITGKVKDENNLRLLIKGFSNIKYLGFLDFDSYCNLLKNEITHCISLRNPKFSSNLFEFPSKILEFLENGKKVISNETYHPVFEDILIKCEYSVKSLYCVIDEPLVNNKIDYEILEDKLGFTAWNKLFKN
jgi:hypothetical protein